MKITAWLLLLHMGVFLTACALANVPHSSAQAVTVMIPPLSTSTAIVTSTPMNPEVPGPTTTPADTENQTERNSMKTITISVGGSSFSAKLYDNETTRALIAQFPLDINMSELNGREKYYNLPENLTSPLTEKPTTIHAGEIMLWSSNSLVLFYKTFSNSYGGYVKLGYVEDVTGLTDALGSGNVRVTFTVRE